MRSNTPVTNGVAWLIYANALDLLAQTFWWTVLVALGVGIAGVAVAGEPSGAVFGLYAGAVTWPVMFGRRARQISSWIAGLDDPSDVLA